MAGTSTTISARLLPAGTPRADNAAAKAQATGWLGLLRFQREDVIDNSATLTAGLDRDDYLMRWQWHPNKNWYYGADYRMSEYNDGNERDFIGADVKFVVSEEPKSLTLGYRYEQYGFDEPRTAYFAPDDFHAHIVSVYWRQLLNKEQVFWGIGRWYYQVMYSVNFDVKDQQGHRIEFDLHKEMKKGTLHFTVGKLLYEHEGIYAEDYIRVYGSIAF